MPACLEGADAASCRRLCPHTLTLPACHPPRKRRFDAVGEERRRQLYDEYSLMLADAGRAPLDGDPQQLEWLRLEQARLKDEYSR